MALVIVSAKNINEANEKSINKKDKKSYIIEDKGLQDFFFEYKDSFSYYDIYYKLEPYGTSKIDNSDIVYIKEFAESVMNFIVTNTELENESIEKFNVSLSKVKRYIKKLIKLTQYAIINSDNLIGLGD
ncbi:hypothetical protein [Finegoldia magna]|uniref:hypothetical protein n=1 Tax=Finegoldia magna TaxID=1260 RepID=UPI0023A9CE54|nr:hypothetical protein [Finegoldia magna]MCC2716916.1 hypothetical protein [Finegoldia magna]